MADQINTYQCPACTGPLYYSGGSGKLECEYCGSSFLVEEIEELYSEKQQEAEQAFEQAAAQMQQDESQWAESDAEWDADAGVVSYHCPSCGAELICDETTAATSCPYCGNPSIVPGQFSGQKKPDFVLPFKLSKADAIETLKGYYAKKTFLPKIFKDENHIQEIKGLYVPFWLFSGEADAAIEFDATTVHTHRTKTERITNTAHYKVYRTGTVTFDRIPVDASSKMPDAYMDSIEPYDYGELKPFSNAYLPGYLADKYDVSIDDCGARADLRATNTTVEQIRATVTGYATTSIAKQKLQLHRGKVDYALLPVWLLHTEWNQKQYLFAINGQTGKVTGELPVDWKRFWLRHAAIAAVITAIGALIAFL